MSYNKILSFVFVIFSILSTNLFFPKINDSKSDGLVKVMKNNEETDGEIIYKSLHSEKFALPRLESFKEALEGFNKLKEKGVISKNILTLIDFSMSSNSKRLWVIDLDANTILYNSLVAHGRNTGGEFAKSFSNVAQSFKSSLGFYLTGEIYNGKHGKSLKLDGLEKGINNNARERAVVIHGADYVSNSFIQNNKRLGRSLGCPAVPLEITEELIKTIKDKSCLFIYYPSKSYKLASKLVS
jgi:hypothetical protein